MSVALEKYNAAKRALSMAVNIDEVKDIRDKAVAMRMYAMQARDRVLIDQATEIRLRAERRAGELLAEMEKNKGTRDQLKGRDSSGGSKRRPPEDATPKLSDLGVNKSQSSRWQKLAGVPADDFEGLVARAQQKACAAVDHAQQPKPEPRPRPKPPKPEKQKATRKQLGGNGADVVTACIAEIAPILRAAMPQIVGAHRVSDLAIELKKTLRAILDEAMLRNTEADDWKTTLGEKR